MNVLLTLNEGKKKRGGSQARPRKRPMTRLVGGFLITNLQYGPKGLAQNGDH